MVSSHQTFSSFAVWNPHRHAIVLEGGFDRCDRFFFIPLGANEVQTEIWRRRAVQWPAVGVVALFLGKGLLNPTFAQTLLTWRHSGFSIDSGTRIYDEDARRSLSRYVVRAPLSLTVLEWDHEPDTVPFKAPQKGYFNGTLYAARSLLSIPDGHGRLPEICLCTRLVVWQLRLYA